MAENNKKPTKAKQLKYLISVELVPYIKTVNSESIEDFVARKRKGAEKRNGI